MKKIKRILFPTDFSEAAQNAFHYTLLLADKLEAEIQVLHAIYPQYEGMDLPVMASQATKKKIEVARTLLETFVDTSVEMVADVLENTATIETQVEIGSPASTITSFAQREEIDLIVMGTQGEHNTLEKLFGSVTSEVIQRAKCHVLAIPEKAKLDKLQIMAFATDLKEADPYHIWELTKLLEPFNPILHCVHVESDQDMEKVLDMNDLETFFSHHAPSLQIKFHNLKGEDLSTTLNDFSETFDVDLIVMTTPYRNFFERLFHKSHTRHMALQTHIPLLIFREEEN
ncbi:MAG: universal stress protein [Lewinellaceae bacterium]|nr:universal stress protein [Lewinellaceae bacterium]